MTLLIASDTTTRTIVVKSDLNIDVREVDAKLFAEYMLLRAGELDIWKFLDAHRTNYNEVAITFARKDI